MILQARSRDNKLFIAMYETESPEEDLFFHSLSKESQDKVLNEWQSSKREYEVRESDFKEINHLLFCYWCTHPTELTGEDAFIKALEKGIDCTFLKDRLELEDDFYVKNRHSRYRQVWTLKKVEEENEAVEFAEWCKNNYKTKDDSRLFVKERTINWISLKEAAESWEEEDCKRYTTPELYQIFKNPNKQ